MPLYWREIDVDDLKNELIKDNEGQEITMADMEQRLRSNIAREQKIMQDLDGVREADYQVQEMSADLEREEFDDVIKDANIEGPGIQEDLSANEAASNAAEVQD